MAIVMTLWIGNCAILKVPVNGDKNNLEINNSFNCH